MRYADPGGETTVPGDPGQATGPEDPLFGYTERFSAVLVAAGFPPMPARVFVALLVADAGRLSAAELAGVLRISPAAVSGAVRYLIQLGMVHKERVPGSRRDYYRMPGGMWDSLIRQRDQVMARWITLVREGIDLVGPDTPAGERLAEQADFLEFTSKELSGVLDRWERHRLERHGLDQHGLDQHGLDQHGLDQQGAGRGLA
jgi:DNA-binding transcriptional regulator GbsR (MarR family)